jgi:hypothetical protein
MRPIPIVVTGVAAALVAGGIAAGVLLNMGGGSAGPAAPPGPVLERFGSYGPGKVLSLVGVTVSVIDDGPDALFCASDARVYTDESGVVIDASGTIGLPVPSAVEQTIEDRAKARARLVLGETLYHNDESVHIGPDGIINPYVPASPDREIARMFFGPVHYDADGILVVGNAFCEPATDEVADEAAAFFAQEAQR